MILKDVSIFSLGRYPWTMDWSQAETWFRAPIFVPVGICVHLLQYLDYIIK